MLLEKIRRFFSLNKKVSENKWSKILLLVLFSGLFLATRLPRLKNDVINPDGVLWHYRSEQFIVGLKFQQFEKTYQHYHPGVTLMWIVGPSVEIFKQITGITVYNSENFETFDLVAKASLVGVQFILSLLFIKMLSKVTGFYKSVLVTALFTFEPFFLANSRLVHLDILSTLLMMLGLTWGYINLKKPSVVNSVITGFLLSTAFLTKSICIGAFVYLFFFSLIYLLINKKRKEILPILSVLLLSFISFTFLLFPALWKDPAYYLMRMIFWEGRRIGVIAGHDQIIFGVERAEGGSLFYPLVFLLKTSPLIIIGIVLFIYNFLRSRAGMRAFIKNIKERSFGFGTFLAVFNLGYIVFMTIASKKVDRYILVMFPFFAYISYAGYESILSSLKENAHKRIFWFVMTALILIFTVFPTIKLFPWYFTYTSPIFGTPSNANNIVGQKPFGVGTPDLKELIIKRYSYDYPNGPTLGMYDTKPMKAIYPNSKIFDVRVYSPKEYNLLVLAINEKIPEKLLSNNKYKYEKDYSLWINGLEYWRIYVVKLSSDFLDVKN